MVRSSFGSPAPVDRVASGSSSVVGAGGVLSMQFFLGYVEPFSVQLFDDDRRRQLEVSDEARRRWSEIRRGKRRQLKVSDEARRWRMEIRHGKRPLDLPSAHLLRCTVQRVIHTYLFV